MFRKGSKNVPNRMIVAGYLLGVFPYQLLVKLHAYLPQLCQLPTTIYVPRSRILVSSNWLLDLPSHTLLIAWTATSAQRWDGLTHIRCRYRRIARAHPNRIFHTDFHNRRLAKIRSQQYRDKERIHTIRIGFAGSFDSRTHRQILCIVHENNTEIRDWWYIHIISMGTNAVI